MLLNLLIRSNYIKIIDISGYVQENKILSETQKLPDPQTLLTLPILYNYGKKLELVSSFLAKEPINRTKSLIRSTKFCITNFDKSRTNVNKY